MQPSDTTHSGIVLTPRAFDGTSRLLMNAQVLWLALIDRAGADDDVRATREDLAADCEISLSTLSRWRDALYERGLLRLTVTDGELVWTPLQRATPEEAEQAATECGLPVRLVQR